MLSTTQCMRSVSYTHLDVYKRQNIIRKHDGDVYIYDVKTEPVQRLAEKGGIACDSAVDAAKHSDVIITMLPRSEDSLSVYKEILPAVNATKICIDMSTIDPSVSLKISVMIQAHGDVYKRQVLYL